MGAQAADWPARPVTVIVGYAAGGNTDVMARMASRTLSEEFRQSFVVDNRIGAGGAASGSLRGAARAHSRTSSARAATARADLDEERAP